MYSGKSQMLKYPQSQKNLPAPQCKGADRFSTDDNLAGNSIVDDALSGIDEELPSPETYMNDLRVSPTHPIGSINNFEERTIKEKLSEMEHLDGAVESQHEHKNATSVLARTISSGHTYIDKVCSQWVLKNFNSWIDAASNEENRGTISLRHERYRKRECEEEGYFKTNASNPRPAL